MKTKWRLPRGVDELLPPDAWELETLRRRILDLFVSWGFEYIEPPIIEYLDALLVGSGEDLDLQTLKVVDQFTGRQLGVRADMTSQAVRVDAHSLVTDDIQRLCYAGNVVFANPQVSGTSRVPYKAGAEIYGSSSLSADAEIVNLMLATVDAAGIEHPVLLLGHMGIYRGLVEALKANGESVDEAELFACIQRKSKSDIAERLSSSSLARMLADLPLFMGDVDTIEAARKRFEAAPESVQTALAELEALVALVRAQHDDVVIRVDVAELSGYGYHNGPVFAVYHPEHGRALAQGGRYDGVGVAFGRARPATGFDVDLKSLLAGREAEEIIFAPFTDDAQERADLMHTVESLRQTGRRVRCALGAGEVVPSGCSQQLTMQADGWRIEVIHRS